MSLNSIFQYFVPKDRKVFFPLFEQAASNVVAIATILVETVNSSDADIRSELYKQIDKLENIGDELTHQIYLELGKNFITPFDREDIHSLATAIDDVADNIQGAANRMNLYKIEDFTLAILIKNTGCCIQVGVVKFFFSVFIYLIL